MRYNYKLKPDYYADETVLHITESFKDDFYVLSAARARILFNLGLPIYELTSVELKCKVYTVADIVEYRPYGIFKDVWKLFLSTEKGEDFVQIWDFVSNIAQSLKGDMMNKVENGSAVPTYYEEIYADESSYIKNYFDDKEEEKSITTGDIRAKVETCLVPLVCEYADRLYKMFYEADANINGKSILVKLLACVAEELREFIDN